MGIELLGVRCRQPAREVRAGDMLRETNDGGEFQVEVWLRSEVRGPASVAQAPYGEKVANREMRLKVAAERKAMRRFEELHAGRPSDHDQGKIIQFRVRG